MTVILNEKIRIQNFRDLMVLENVKGENIVAGSFQDFKLKFVTILYDILLQ